MSGYVLSPLAQADLDQIWDYTAERWDEDQADRYIFVVRAAIEAVARDPREAVPATTSVQATASTRRVRICCFFV